MIKNDFPNGVFPSVALDAGVGYMAVRESDPRQAGAIVVYQWQGTNVGAAIEVHRWPVPPESPAFPSLHVVTQDHQLWLAYHDGRWLWLKNLSSGAIMDFTALSNPVAFGDQFFAYCEPAAPYQVHRMDLVSGQITLPRLGAPTGLSRIVNGQVITVDEDRMAMPGATIPSFAGFIQVGEGHDRGVSWATTTTPQTHGTIWYPLDSFTPKCAADGNRFAICTAGSGSVRLFCGSIEDLEASSIAPPDPIVRIGRPLWCGFFVFGADRTTVAIPGNSRVLIPEGVVVDAAGRMVAQYVASEGAGPTQDAINLNAAIRSAHIAWPGVPVMAYWTHQAQLGAVPMGADLMGVEAYRGVDESLVAFEARIRAAVKRVPAAVLIAQCYTSNTGNHPDIAALVPVYARLARDCSSIVGILAFSGAGRATGLQDHVEVRPLWTELAAGVPRTPTVVNPPQEDLPVNPKITVKRFDSSLVKGQPWSVDATIGDTDVTVRIGGDGNLTIRAKNPAGEDATGAPRHVAVQG